MFILWWYRCEKAWIPVWTTPVFSPAATPLWWRPLPPTLVESRLIPRTHPLVTLCVIIVSRFGCGSGSIKCPYRPSLLPPCISFHKLAAVPASPPESISMMGGWWVLSAHRHQQTDADLLKPERAQRETCKLSRSLAWIHRLSVYYPGRPGMRQPHPPAIDPTPPPPPHLGGGRGKSNPTDSFWRQLQDRRVIKTTAVAATRDWTSQAAVWRNCACDNEQRAIIGSQGTRRRWGNAAVCRGVYVHVGYAVNGRRCLAAFLRMTQTDVLFWNVLSLPPVITINESDFSSVQRGWSASV